MQMKRLGAAAVIFNDEGHVLLVKQSYGHLNWELPGGAAEMNESIVETAVREVFEETGLRVEAEKIIGFYYEPETDFHHFVFLCHQLDSNAAFHHDSEVTDCAFWPPNSLPRPISDFTIRRIKDGLLEEFQKLPINIGARVWFK